MAEELVIRVKVDGFSDREGSQANNNSLAAGAIGGAVTGGINLDTQERSRQRRERISSLASALASVNRTVGVPMTMPDRQTFSGLGGGIGFSSIGQFRTLPNQTNITPDTSIDDTTNQFFNKGRAMASAAAWKIASSAVQIQSHRSGDSHANANMNNAMKLAGYGAAIAASGPAAPFVAAGIVLNEAISGTVGAINYNYDRRMGGLQRQNMAALAGNVSYGRRGGNV